MTDALKAAAHDYHKRGWRVIQLHHITEAGTCSCGNDPCGKDNRNAGKHPIMNKWQETPRHSGADLEALWDDRPNANIGIATGPASGFWVLDIDPDNGGMKTMAALVAEHGALPATFVTQTGSGGYHYFFRLPVGVELRNSADRVGKGIDTRAGGGQIVAPPSISAKGPYSVVQDAPVAAAPEWLIEAARKSETVLPVVTAEDLPKPEEYAPEEWDRLNSYAKTVVDAEVQRLKDLHPDVWEARGSKPWNHTTFQVACSLLEIANSPWNSYSAEHAQADLFKHAPRDPEFDDLVITKCWNSATERIGQNARPVPVDRSSEPDPLFDNPDIRGSRTPTEGGAGEAIRTVEVEAEINDWDFFDKKDLLAVRLAHQIAARGPIGWGRDSDFWEYEDGVWKPRHFVVMDRTIALLGDRYRPAHYNTVKDVVRKNAVPISGDPFEDLMNFRNGMLDWRTGTLVDHDPAYASTVQLGPVWDPEATCPKFDAFLADVMHEDYVALAWEMLGYLMLSGNPQHVAFLFYGVGGNGKSTLMDVIQRLLGSDNIASESLNDLNGNRFRAASLFGRIANLAGDIDATYQENTATFKRLTGEDEITAEHKHQAPFRFQSWAVNVFSANKFPGSADVTEGYLRRWIVLHFHKMIPVEKRIDRAVLMTQFEAELSGIAAKAVAALRVQQARGHFDPQGEATKGKEEFARKIDQVRAWVTSGDPVSAPEAWSSLIDLYASYTIWADRSGQHKVREQEFSDRLEAIGLPTQRMGGVLSHKGLLVGPAAAKPLHTTETVFNDND